MFLKSFLRFFTDLKSSMQTVLLCNPCGDLLCDMEERFWNAVYRLKNSLRHNRVLPGAGAIEIACVQRLVKLAGEYSPEASLSTNAMSQPFPEYCRIVWP